MIEQAHVRGCSARMPAPWGLVQLLLLHPLHLWCPHYARCANAEPPFRKGQKLKSLRVQQVSELQDFSVLLDFSFIFTSLLVKLWPGSKTKWKLTTHEYLRLICSLPLDICVCVCFYCCCSTDWFLWSDTWEDYREHGVKFPQVGAGYFNVFLQLFVPLRLC